MTLTIIILAILLIGMVYIIAKQRGERKKAIEVMDHEGKLDEREIKDELEEKRDSDAWDNLNDTIDDIGGK